MTGLGERILQWYHSKFDQWFPFRADKGLWVMKQCLGGTEFYPLTRSCKSKRYIRRQQGICQTSQPPPGYCAQPTGGQSVRGLARKTSPDFQHNFAFRSPYKASSNSNKCLASAHPMFKPALARNLKLPRLFNPRRCRKDPLAFKSCANSSRKIHCVSSSAPQEIPTVHL